MTRTDILIAGAGPSGLVLALWLAKQGLSVRIVDKAAQAGTTSRAVAVAAHTLELYRQLDLADAVMQHAHPVAAANLWVQGRAVARVPVAEVGRDLSPYGLLQIFPQDAHEHLLIDRLAAIGIQVERSCELVDFSEDTAGIIARLHHLADDREEICAARFIAGCDGARSAVRKTLGIGFAGGTYKELFYVADVQATGTAANGELHIDLDRSDFLAVFPLDGEGRARLIGTVRDERAGRDDLGFDDVRGHALATMDIAIDRVNWFSTYHVHHRVADRFRQGHAFLVGDAAHIHSPAGGQGMNTGIGDAINLAWKLAAVVRQGAPNSLLDSYQAERLRFARRLVATTDRVFTFANADGRIAETVRTRIAPLLIPRLLSNGRVRDFAFRTISQIGLNYRHGPLAMGTAGRVRGGDRLPWAPAGGIDNFDAITDPIWQVHVYGSGGAPLVDWCWRHHVPLHRYDWHDRHGQAGLAHDAIYLLRPDTYVALAAPAGTDTDAAAALDRYFKERGLPQGNALA